MRKAGKYLGLCAIGLSLGLGPVPARAMEEISIQLDWVVRGAHAMFFVARDKGYFEREGIKVASIRKGTGTPDALRLVGNGDADFGFGDLPTLAVARSEGVPVVALVAVNERSPLAMISLAKRKILRTPADLKGLNIGIHPAGSTYVFLKAFLKANGMTEADLTETTVSPPYEGDLLHGRVDAIPGYMDAEVPELEAKAGGKGSLSILQGADHGWNVLGSGVFTSERMIEEKPDLVQRFVKAYMTAFEEVMARPRDAVEIMAKADPEYADGKAVLLEQLETDIKSTFTNEDSRARGLGWMSRERWRRTVAVLTDQGVLKTPVGIDALYTDKFVEAAR
jgi:NitT/TauT family transport system substrate-binding protein